MLANNGPGFFTIRLKNKNLCHQWSSLALTSRLHIFNPFQWFGPHMSAEMEVDVLSCCAHVIRRHDFPYDCIINLPCNNFEIIGRSRPSFSALVHLLYGYGKIAVLTMLLESVHLLSVKLLRTLPVNSWLDLYSRRFSRWDVKEVFLSNASLPKFSIIFTASQSLSATCLITTSIGEAARSTMSPT